MKTAISIPDDVFERAEQLARTLKMSRSGLYTQAVREYVARHSDDAITAALNAAIDDGADEDLEFVRAAARAILERTEW
jgi:predicted transcriptional regulator